MQLNHFGMILHIALHVRTRPLCLTLPIERHADGDNEVCVFNVLKDATLQSIYFSTENYFDYILIGSTRFSGSTGPSGVTLVRGSYFQW